MLEELLKKTCQLALYHSKCSKLNALLKLPISISTQFQGSKSVLKVHLPSIYYRMALFCHFNMSLPGPSSCCKKVEIKKIIKIACKNVDKSLTHQCNNYVFKDMFADVSHGLKKEITENYHFTMIVHLSFLSFLGLREGVHKMISSGSFVDAMFRWLSRAFAELIPLPGICHGMLVSQMIAPGQKGLKQAYLSKHVMIVWGFLIEINMIVALVWEHYAPQSSMWSKWGQRWGLYDN